MLIGNILTLIVFCYSLTVSGQIDILQPESTDSQIINHTYYTLSYSEQHEQAEWVIYKLTNARLVTGQLKRTNNFRSDQNVETKSAELLDYKNFGFDRGHLVPAGDMKFSYEAMSESFLLSNISPQRPGFNRGIWKNLENQIRFWAQTYDSVFIVTAGVLNDSLPKIGINSVSVPSHFYKIVLRLYNDDIASICFVLPNERSDKRLQEFVISIDSLEKLSGIDFFYKLHPVTQNKIECCSDTTAWTW